MKPLKPIPRKSGEVLETMNPGAAEFSMSPAVFPDSSSAGLPMRFVPVPSADSFSPRNLVSPLSLHSESPINFSQSPVKPRPLFRPINHDDPSAVPCDSLHGASSPSMMTHYTGYTTETASMTTWSSYNMGQQQFCTKLDNSLGGSRQSPRPKRRGGRPFSPRPSTPLDRDSSTRSSSGRKSPYVDENRKTRVKTELCVHITRGNPCPYGHSCSFAHNEEELQMTKLVDMQEAGLIEIETYRIQPCFTWVSTGSCPFGKRCTNIHDPRVGGTVLSWLTHTETQGNEMETDINVDALHQKRSQAMLHNNPFGEQFCLKTDTFVDLYKLVCNVKNTKKNSWVDKRRRIKLDPIFQLQIALKLRSNPDWQYKFCPKNIIHGELCMILQTRAFRLNRKTMEIVDLALDQYRARDENHVIVREIAFGPDRDQTIRGVSLWFQLDERDIRTCDPEQAKNFRWKRSPKSKETIRISTFDTLDHFEMIRPHCKYAYALTTDIIRHRLHVMKASRKVDNKARAEALAELSEKKTFLISRFERQKKYWEDWAWPINEGREEVDSSTPVPPIDGVYCIPEEELGKSSSPIWKSFTTAFSLDEGDTEDGYDFLLGNVESAKHPRLSVFEILASGEGVSSDRTLPYILDWFFGKKKDSKSDTQPPEAERCWKSLLLKDNVYNEWEDIYTYFNNSHSKKVISIIQKPESW